MIVWYMSNMYFTNKTKATTHFCLTTLSYLGSYLPRRWDVLQWDTKAEGPGVVSLVDGIFGRVVGVALEDDLVVEDVDLILGLCDFGGDDADKVDFDASVFDG